MTVFLAASDESSGATETSGAFVAGGFVAPESTWDNVLSPAWRERVLEGPPSIPFLHMTDVRKPRWRDKYQIQEWEADARVEEAVRVIRSTGRLHPVTSQVDSAAFARTLARIDIQGVTGNEERFERDYICFLLFAMHVLNNVVLTYPDTTRVDFVAEHSSSSKERMLRKLFADLPGELVRIGLGRAAPVVGHLRFRGKDDIPLQAADLVCWHERRLLAYGRNGLDSATRRRYARISRMIGFRHRWSDEALEVMAGNLEERARLQPLLRQPRRATKARQNL